MRIITTSELRKIQIGILDVIDAFCFQNGLTYYLCGGTLLGAVRHKGYIPWDDDIDIMMPRPDYERFITDFHTQDYLKVISHKTDPYYPFAFATVNDTRTWKNETKLRKKYTKDVCVNVDVFPIDGLPDDQNEIKEIYRKVKLYGDYLQMATYKFGKGTGFLSTIKKNIGIFIWRIAETLLLVSTDKMIERFSNVSKEANSKNAAFYRITAISHYGTSEVNHASVYSETVKVKFEGKEYPAPIGYVEYLSKLYGKNFMKIPPKKMQKTHHVSNNYWK